MNKEGDLRLRNGFPEEGKGQQDSETADPGRGNVFSSEK